jgi:hypothetical protein
LLDGYIIHSLLIYSKKPKAPPFGGALGKEEGDNQGKFLHLP